MIGIQIYAGGRWRKLGRLFVCPPAMPILGGQKVLYRENPRSNVWSWKLNCLSIDTKGWAWASHLGAAFLVDYFTDTQQLCCVLQSDVEASYTETLGQGLQYRIDEESVYFFDDMMNHPLRVAASWKVKKWIKAAFYPEGWEAPTPNWACSYPAPTLDDHKPQPPKDNQLNLGL